MIESVTYYFVYRVICYLPSYSYVSMRTRAMHGSGFCWSQKCSVNVSVIRNIRLASYNIMHISVLLWTGPDTTSYY